MSDIQLAGIAIALFSLIFSEFPFIQLLYLIACMQVLDWQGLSTITGLMVISTVGATIYKGTKI